YPRRLFLRLCKRHYGIANVSQSGFRCCCTASVGSCPVLYRSELLFFEEIGSPLSGRDGLWLLSRGSGSHQAARRSRATSLGEPLLLGRRAIFLGGPHLHVGG